MKSKCTIQSLTLLCGYSSLNGHWIYVHAWVGNCKHPRTRRQYHLLFLHFHLWGQHHHLLGEIKGLQKALRFLTCHKFWDMPITFWCWHQWCHDAASIVGRVGRSNHCEEGRVCLERNAIRADKNAQIPSTSK